MNKEKTRASLLAIAAVYLLYLAYELFQNREAPTTMAPAARILFIALFALAAAGLLVYACFIWKNSKKGGEEEPPPEDKNELK